MVLIYLISTMFKATFTTCFRRQDKRLFVYHLPLLIIYRVGNASYSSQSQISLNFGRISTLSLPLSLALRKPRRTSKKSTHRKRRTSTLFLMESPSPKPGLRSWMYSLNWGIPISIRALYSTKRNRLVTWRSTIRSLRATVTLTVLF